MPDLVVARRPRGRLIAASFEPRVPSTPTTAILEKPAPSAHHPSRSLPPLWIDRPDNRTPSNRSNVFRQDRSSWITFANDSGVCVPGKLQGNWFEEDWLEEEWLFEDARWENFN